MYTTPQAVELYSNRTDRYVGFVRSMGYPEGIRAYLLRSPLLRSDLRVLDAGCGTGIATLALHEALQRRGLTPGPMHAFDLTEAMLERFRSTLRLRNIDGIEIERADVLELNRLPASWGDYDLVVSASMLEYLSPKQLSTALGGLHRLMKEGGNFVLFITRRNWLTRPLIGRWWQANLFEKNELVRAFYDAGFSSVVFRRFPPLFRHLSIWGHVIEARSSARSQHTSSDAQRRQ